MGCRAIRTISTSWCINRRTISEQITGQAYPVPTVKKETIDNNEHSQIQSTTGTGVAQG